MAALLPETFVGGKGPLTSFDFYDATYGSGYKTFYLCRSDNSAGDQFFLSTEDINSSSQKYFLGPSSETQDFDLLFNNPMTVKGEAIFAWYQTQKTVSTGDVTITVYHVRGITETSLGTATHSQLATAGSDLYYRSELLKVSLTTKQFAKADKLRIEVAFTKGGAKSGYVYMRSGTEAYPFKAMIPFRIEI
jgi:hypothetical protein